MELKNNQIALPIANTKNHTLDFKQYILGENLVQNKEYKNIFEPNPQNNSIIPEIIFVPLVACDKNGNRIGMGRGFYDRTIAQIQRNNEKIITIGLSYDFQILDKIETDELDQSLDFIVCENNIIRCNTKSQIYFADKKW